MIFRSRFDKQIQRIKENNREKRVYDEDDVRNVLEKNDVLAMILSALLVILPASIAALVIVSAIGRFFVVRG